jgi:hypothetical protein
MDLVALPELKTINCRDLGGRYLIDVECTNAYWNCPKCGGDQLYDHAAREVDYTDTPLHGMPCLIRLKKRRQRCKDCKHVCACAPDQPFDDDFRMTVRCAQWIEQQAIDRTFTAIAEDLGVDEKVVRGVFARYSENHIKELDAYYGAIRTGARRESVRGYDSKRTPVRWKANSIPLNPPRNLLLGIPKAPSWKRNAPHAHPDQWVTFREHRRVNFREQQRSGRKSHPNPIRICHLQSPVRPSGAGNWPGPGSPDRCRPGR